MQPEQATAEINDQSPISLSLKDIVIARRKKLCLAPKEVSKRMEFRCPDSYRAIERGDTAFIIPSVAKRLSAALGLDSEDLEPFVKTILEREQIKAKPPQSKIGKLIRTKRLEQELSQAQLGKKIGVTRALISAMELGKVTFYKSTHLSVLSQVLEIKLGVLESLKQKKRRLPKVSRASKLTLGIFLTRKRRSRGLTQLQLAKRAGVGTTTICQIERDQKPKSKIVLKVIAALGCEVPAHLLPPHLLSP